MNTHRVIYAYIALTAAVAVGLFSFFLAGDITANLLILVAQFLLFALTMAGFGRLAEQILTILRNGKNLPTLHTGRTDSDTDGTTQHSQQ